MFCRKFRGDCLRYFLGVNKETALVGGLGETLEETLDANFGATFGEALVETLGKALGETVLT